MAKRSIDGKNVAELRDATGVKAGVSKVVQGVHDRVLTVVGSLKSVAKVSLPEMMFIHLSQSMCPDHHPFLGLRPDSPNTSR